MDVTAPAVVSVNGLLASAAVNEFAVYVSGIRCVNPYTEVDLLGAARAVPGQWVTPRIVSKAANCIACSTAGQGDRTDIERYWRRSK